MDAAVQQLSEFSSLSKTAVTTASPAPVQPTAVQKACHALSSLQQLLVAIGSGENAGGDQLGGAIAALEGVAVVMQSTHDQTVLKQSLVLIQAVAPCRVFQPSIVRHCWPIIWQILLLNHSGEVDSTPTNSQSSAMENCFSALQAISSHLAASQRTMACQHLTTSLRADRLAQRLTSLILTPTCTLHALRVWQTLVRFMGALLQDTRCINALLKTIEVALRTGDVQVRCRAVFAWSALVDSFLAGGQLASNTKRLRLLVVPLAAPSGRCVKLSAAKLVVWWRLVCGLGSRLNDVFDLVVLPLLRACFGKPVDTSAGITTAGSPLTAVDNVSTFNVSSVSSTGTSDVSMLSLSGKNSGETAATKTTHVLPCHSQLLIPMVRHILAALFSPPGGGGSVAGGSNSSSGGSLCVTRCSDTDTFSLSGAPSESVLCRRVLLTHWSQLVHVVVTAVQQVTPSSSSASDDRQRVAADVFRPLCDRVLAELASSEKQQLSNQDISASINAEISRLVNMMSLLVHELPVSFLSSSAHHMAGNVLLGCPALYLLQRLSSSTRWRHWSSSGVWIKLVTAALSEQLQLLPRLAQLLKYFEQSELWCCYDNLDQFAHVWQCLAEQLRCQVEQTQEVDAGDALGFDFTPIIDLLVLPMSAVLHSLTTSAKEESPPTPSPQENGTSLWNRCRTTWLVLYPCVARAADLVTTAPANALADQLCGRLLKLLQSVDSGPALVVAGVVGECVGVVVQSALLSQPDTPQIESATGVSVQPLLGLSQLFTLLERVVSVTASTCNHPTARSPKHTSTSGSDSASSGCDTGSISSLTGCVSRLCGHVRSSDNITQERVMSVCGRVLEYLLTKCNHPSADVISCVCESLDALISAAVRWRQSGISSSSLRSTCSPLLLLIPATWPQALRLWQLVLQPLYSPGNNRQSDSPPMMSKSLLAAVDSIMKVTNASSSAGDIGTTSHSSPVAAVKDGGVQKRLTRRRLSVGAGVTTLSPTAPAARVKRRKSVAASVVPTVSWSPVAATRKPPSLIDSDSQVEFFVPPKPKSLSAGDDSAINRSGFEPGTVSGCRRVLTEHQRERLRARRDDIPALYADLSQDTQSQSLMASQSQQHDTHHHQQHQGQLGETSDKQRLSFSGIGLADSADKSDNAASDERDKLTKVDVDQNSVLEAISSQKDAPSTSSSIEFVSVSAVSAPSVSVTSAPAGSSISSSLSASTSVRSVSPVSAISVPDASSAVPARMTRRRRSLFAPAQVDDPPSESVVKQQTQKSSRRGRRRSCAPVMVAAAGQGTSPPSNLSPTSSLPVPPSDRETLTSSDSPPTSSPPVPASDRGTSLSPTLTDQGTSTSSCLPSTSCVPAADQGTTPSSDLPPTHPVPVPTSDHGTSSSDLPLTPPVTVASTTFDPASFVIAGLVADKLPITTSSTPSIPPLAVSSTSSCCDSALPVADDNNQAASDVTTRRSSSSDNNNNNKNISTSEIDDACELSSSAADSGAVGVCSSIDTKISTPPPLPSSPVNKVDNDVAVSGKNVPTDQPAKMDDIDTGDKTLKECNKQVAPPVGDKSKQENDPVQLSDPTAVEVPDAECGGVSVSDSHQVSPRSPPVLEAKAARRRVQSPRYSAFIKQRRRHSVLTGSRASRDPATTTAAPPLQTDTSDNISSADRARRRKSAPPLKLPYDLDNDESSDCVKRDPTKQHSERHLQLKRGRGRGVKSPAGMARSPGVFTRTRRRSRVSLSALSVQAMLEGSPLDRRPLEAASCSLDGKQTESASPPDNSSIVQNESCDTDRIGVDAGREEVAVASSEVSQTGSSDVYAAPASAEISQLQSADDACSSPSQHLSSGQVEREAANVINDEAGDSAADDSVHVSRSTDDAEEEAVDSNLAGVDAVEEVNSAVVATSITEKNDPASEGISSSLSTITAPSENKKPNRSKTGRLAVRRSRRVTPQSVNTDNSVAAEMSEPDNCIVEPVKPVNEPVESCNEMVDGSCSDSTTECMRSSDIPVDRTGATDDAESTCQQQRESIEMLLMSDTATDDPLKSSSAVDSNSASDTDCRESGDEDLTAPAEEHSVDDIVVRPSPGDCEDVQDNASLTTDVKDLGIDFVSHLAPAQWTDDCQDVKTALSPSSEALYSDEEEVLSEEKPKLSVNKQDSIDDHININGKRCLSLNAESRAHKLIKMAQRRNGSVSVKTPDSSTLDSACSTAVSASATCTNSSNVSASISASAYSSNSSAVPASMSASVSSPSSGSISALPAVCVSTTASDAGVSIRGIGEDDSALFAVPAAVKNEIQLPDIECAVDEVDADIKSVLPADTVCLDIASDPPNTAKNEPATPPRPQLRLVSAAGCSPSPSVSPRRQPWVRHIYSPAASPSAGILKRRAHDPQRHQTVENAQPVAIDSVAVVNICSPNFSPLSARRRVVQFADPPVSDRVEIPLSLRRGALPLRQRPLAASLSSPSGEQSQRRRRTLTALAEFQSVPVGVATVAANSPPPSVVSSSAAVCPTLVGCEDSIDAVLDRLSSPAGPLRAGLGRLLVGRGLKTVGQLAGCSSAVVEQLPLPAPRLSNVCRALSEYAAHRSPAKSTATVSTQTEPLRYQQLRHLLAAADPQDLLQLLREGIGNCQQLSNLSTT